MKRLVIFDLDGTLLDTLEDLKNALNAALTAQGFPERTLDEVRGFVGNGIRLLVERGVPEGTPEAEIITVYDSFRRYYAAHLWDNTRPYPGIPALLAALRRREIRLAVASNKRHDAAEALCRRFFPDTLEFTLGETEGIPKKPAPDMLAKILGALDIPKSAALYVGDSQVDVETAKNTGIDSAIVTWGFRSRPFLERCGAARLIDRPEELLALL